MIAKALAWLKICIVAQGVGVADVLAGRALASCVAESRLLAFVTWHTVNWNG